MQSLGSHICQCGEVNVDWFNNINNQNQLFHRITDTEWSEYDFEDCLKWEFMSYLQFWFDYFGILIEINLDLHIESHSAIINEYEPIIKGFTHVQLAKGKWVTKLQITDSNTA